jgi:hypothetical protein
MVEKPAFRDSTIATVCIGMFRRQALRSTVKKGNFSHHQQRRLDKSALIQPGNGLGVPFYTKMK